MKETLAATALAAGLLVAVKNKYLKRERLVSRGADSLSDLELGCKEKVRSLQAEDDDPYRLPLTLKPVHYDLVIKTDLETDSYSGAEDIHLKVIANTSTIVLNIISTVKVQTAFISTPTSKGFKSIASDALRIDERYERLYIQLSDKLIKGQDIVLRLSFKSDLSNSMTGYYLSRYSASKSSTDAAHAVVGNKSKADFQYTLTHHEPTYARRSLPLFDEPLLKATFSVKMISRVELTSLANEQAISDSPLGTSASSDELVQLAVSADLKDDFKSSDWKVTSFRKTPPMSTYLLAFANGAFEYVEDFYTSLSGEKKPLRLYSTKDVIDQCHYALSVTKLAMPLFEKLFDIEYPLAKLDSLVATDFDIGAMENWGLICSRTSALLVDDKTSGLAARKAVASTQIHEISHLWLGDIVGTRWWDEVWLKESFATFAGELIAPDILFPEWKVRESFITSHLFTAMTLDSKRSSHPIQVPLEDPHTINEVFDSISYSKGGSVLRMIESLVGKEVFLKGVSLYLKKHLYGNATTNDLWDGISQASGLDIASIASPWTLKVGFPVLTVDEDPSKGTVRIRQNRFLASGGVKPEEDETIWPTPLEILKIASSGETTIDHSLLTLREGSFSFGESTNFKLNANTTGVYRVLYTPSRLTALGNEASKSSESALTASDRVGLVSDVFALAFGGYSKTTDALAFVKKLVREDSELVWTQVVSSLGLVSNVWWEQPEDVQRALNQIKKSLFGPIYERLGFDFKDDDEPAVRELRSLIIGAAAGAGYEPVLQEIKDRFNLYMEKDDDSLIPPDAQRTIFVTSVSSGGEKEYRKLREVYRHPPNPSTKINVMIALASTQDAVLIEETLGMITSSDIKDQDVSIVISSIAANHSARRRGAQWFKESFDYIDKRFSGNAQLGSFVYSAFSALTTAEDYQDLKAFFSKKDTSKFAGRLAQTLEEMSNRTAWLKREKDEVKKWLLKP